VAKVLRSLADTVSMGNGNWKKAIQVKDIRYAVVAYGGRFKRYFHSEQNAKLAAIEFGADAHVEKVH